MEELLGLDELGASFTGLIESDAFQFVIYVIIAYVVLIWLASAFWAYRDMRLRSASAVAPYVAAAAIIIFTPIFFLFGLLIYRIVRPKETIAEVSERALAEEAIMAEVASHAQCANCSRPVHEDWIICPTCRNRLRRVCPNCEHLIELDWTLCAWCGKDFERAEAPGTAAYMPTARPAPRPQQHQHVAAPPPAQRVPPPPAAPQSAASTPAAAAATAAAAAGGAASAPVSNPAQSAPGAAGNPTQPAATQPAATQASNPSTQPPTAPQQPAPRSSQASSGTPPPAGTQPVTGER